jgi:predicted TIM-barrel fold metal-dependent hydrolase
MDNAGVDKTFLISYDAEDTRWGAEHQGFGMEDFAGGRKYTLQQVRQFPSRFYWFSTLKSPTNYPTLGHIDRDIAEGAAGFKLFPAFIQATLDIDVWTTIFKRIRDANKILLLSFEFVVPGESHSIDEYYRQLDRALEAVPDLRLALLHAGCVDPLAPQGRLLTDFCHKWPRVMVSMADPGEIWDDGVEYPFPNLLARVERLVSKLGVERLMWATDWPWGLHNYVYRQSIDCFRLHAPFLDAGALEMYLGGNAERFVSGS